MKKVLTVLGGIFICLILVGAIVYSGLYYYGSGLDKEAQTYIDEVVPRIVTYWNSRELVDHASPEFLQVFPAKKVELLFDAFSEQMGPLKEYTGATGKVKISIRPKGMAIIADYEAKVIFEKAPAKIEIQMIRHNDKWEIVGFLVKLKLKD